MAVEFRMSITRLKLEMSSETAIHQTDNQIWHTVLVYSIILLLQAKTYVSPPAHCSRFAYEMNPRKELCITKATIFPRLAYTHRICIDLKSEQID